MPRARAALLLLAAAVTPLPAAGTTDCTFDSAGYEQATRTILCDCGCHPQSVHECACGRAAEMRREIHQTMAEQCLSGEALIALYVERHGEQIRIAPTATGFNLVAWLGPLLGLAGACLGLVVVLRRWSRRPAAAGPPATPTPALPVDQAYHDRLRDALERLE